MKYVVIITETLEKGIIVDADNVNEAIKLAKEVYDNEGITLDYRDYSGYEIECDREADEWDIANYVDVEDL